MASAVLFLLAWPLFFRLFSPGRYLKFAPLIYLIFLSAITLNKVFLEKRPGVFKLLVLCAIIILIYLLSLDKDIEYFQNKGLYAFLSDRPKDALIAGHPDDMNEIPLLAKRKVFVQFESSLPYYRNYYDKVKKRTYDFFRLYYSNDKNEINEICSFYDIDYLVIKKEHFSEFYINREEFYTSPFNEYIQEIIRKNRNQGFILSDVPEKYRAYEDENFVVVKTHGTTFIN